MIAISPLLFAHLPFSMVFDMFECRAQTDFETSNASLNLFALNWRTKLSKARSPLRFAASKAKNSQPKVRSLLRTSNNVQCGESAKPNQTRPKQTCEMHWRRRMTNQRTFASSFVGSSVHSLARIQRLRVVLVGFWIRLSSERASELAGKPNESAHCNSLASSSAIAHDSRIARLVASDKFARSSARSTDLPTELDRTAVSASNTLTASWPILLAS